MKNEISVILGKKGSGKTSYVKGKLLDYKRLVIFDFNREYSGYYVVSNPSQLIEVLKLNFENEFQVCYQPSPEMAIDEHFTFLSEAIFTMRNMVFLCEEIDLVSGAGDMPDGLKKIINYGRHRQISLIGLSRRAHKVPRDLTANADKIITFTQYEPRDIKYLSEYMGDEAATRVQTLKRTETDAEFLEWEEGELKSGVVNFVDKSIKYN